MSASQSRVTDEINLDEFERRLRAAGAQQAQAEDPLEELSRLVEFSHMGIANGETPARPGAEAGRAKPPTSIETESLRPMLDDDVEGLTPGASEDDRAARRDYEFDERHSATDSDEERRPTRWKIAVSGLALAGVAMIGGVFALKHGAPGFSKDPPFIAAAQGPTKVAPPSDQTVSTSSDAGASLLHDKGKPGAVKVVNSEEQPVDLNAQASVNNPPSANSAPPAGATDATALAATINTPLVAPAPAGPPNGTAPDFPDPKPVRTISLRPDGTPIAMSSPPDQPASAANAAPPPAEQPSKPAGAPSAPAPKTTSDATGVAQPSTPKIELPTKLSPKSSARVAVGKTDTTAPEAAAQTPGGPTQDGAPAKPEKAAKKSKATQVVDATETTGAIAPPVDATAATTSGGWSVQLAAPKSEAEAKSAAAKLNSKYSAELNGSQIGVHKAEVKGETIYRLRVSGLTKADAAALCARLKGEGGQCFIAK
ncbi:MAG TPA: SPOR domain-containing protein [Roseiarcus sp.]